MTSLSEWPGYKSGLALTREEIATHLPQFGEFVTGPDDQAIRVRSEEYEQLVRWLLYKVGRIPTPHLISPTITQYHKYKKEAKKHALQSKVATFVDEYPKAIEKAQPGGRTAVDVVPEHSLGGCL